ncbi:MAG: M15 family metallopeptidase [Clostridiales bacterium]|nr:M15 family metallopeptidase [Clostridiales bacterium]
MIIGKWQKVLLLAAALLLLPFSAPAEEEDFSLEEIIEDVDLDAVTYGDVEWVFPVALEDLNPEYIRLANKHYLLDSDYVPSDLVKVPSKPAKGGIYWAVQPKEGQLLRADCAAALCDLNAAIMEAAEENGYKALYLKSAYRSYRTQKTMYNNRLQKNHGKDDGWVSQPGASDHQTGLGCDVVPRSWRDKAMNDKMMKEPECQWMAEHCQEFGFIVRYPEGRQDITEINTEPWHLRYVGIPAAVYIMENGLCLEEFVWQLQAAIQDFLDRGGNPEIVAAYVQTPTDPDFVIPE